MTQPIRIIGSPDMAGELPLLGDGVCCYARVSSEQPNRQTLSPDAQIETMRAYCRLRSLGEPIIVTERKSAKNLRGRPEFLKILTWVRSRQIRHLVVCEITRLSRDLGDVRAVFDTLADNGVELHGASRAIDLKTADGSFVTHLDALLGERERLKIGERTKAALAAKPRVQYDPAANPAMQWYAMNRRYLGRMPLLGYRWRKKIRDDRLKIVSIEENPREIRMIRRMFELRRSGLTYQAVAKAIALEGYRTRRGGLFPFRRIEKIIHTQMYWSTVNEPLEQGDADGSGRPGGYEPVGAGADPGAAGGVVPDGTGRSDVGPA